VDRRSGSGSGEKTHPAARDGRQGSADGDSVGRHGRAASDPIFGSGADLKQHPSFSQVEGLGARLEVQTGLAGYESGTLGGGRPKGSSGRREVRPSGGGWGTIQTRQVNAGRSAPLNLMETWLSSREKVRKSVASPRVARRLRRTLAVSERVAGPVNGWCSPPRCCSPHRGLRKFNLGVNHALYPADTARNTPAVPTASWTSAASGTAPPKSRRPPATPSDPRQQTRGPFRATMSDQGRSAMVLRTLRPWQEPSQRCPPEPGGHLLTVYLRGCEHQHRERGTRLINYGLKVNTGVASARTRSKSRTFFTTTNGFPVHNLLVTTW